MRAYMTSLNIGIVSIVIIILLLLTKFQPFQQRDETLKTSEKDNYRAIMDAFRQKDRQFVDDVLNLDPKSLTETDAMYKFYKIVSFPVQGVCRMLKRIGGVWADWPDLPAYAVDGDKFVCMDDLSMGKPCLIYSFGINNDWTFEDFMDFRGCEIHGHDPTVDFPAKRGDHISFWKLGLGVATEPTMDTLANILKKNGHSKTKIDVLKIDIEAHEIAGLPNWLATGALDNVNQLAIELHLSSLHDGPKFIWLLEVLQEMYRLNFRVISHEVNMAMGPGSHKLYNFMEVVFMKDNVWNDSV